MAYSGEDVFMVYPEVEGHRGRSYEAQDINGD